MCFCNSPRTAALPVRLHSATLRSRRPKFPSPPLSSLSARRLGLPGGDAAGFPQSRRLFDDVTDISLRAVAGVLAGAPFQQQCAELSAGRWRESERCAFPDVFPVLRRCSGGAEPASHRSG
ncbi:MAG: DUF4331 domain-containing protein [Acidobacteria bacterium]|nr:DUF4331 domain-containing protein [Acidobacteriota bacterium]